MGKIAFVFSGQGDQFPGMGKDLAAAYPAAAAVFELCDKLRPGTSAQCFAGTEEELKETKNTQPCLFATVAGVFDSETGFRLVCRRGELMQREAERFDTAMAAVVKLTPAQVGEICENYRQVYPVNFNCPGQITVSGLAAQMPDFFADVKEAGGRAIPLKVKGAFHSPFMNAAAEAFAKELAAAPIRTNEVPLYSNLTAQPYTDDVVGMLSRQICSPVQWEGSIRRMIADGVDTFIEIGPGQTLTNMIKKIDTAVTACSVTEYFAEVASC